MPNKEDIAELHGLLVMKLGSLYDIETELVKALPNMAAKASDATLRQALEQHQLETQGHVERLEKAFEILGEKPRKMRSEAIRGLIEDAKWVFKNIKEPSARDVGIVASAQCVEHYEMGAYNAARQWAQLMGHSEVEQLLDETVQEEKNADQKLNELATSRLNEQAYLTRDDEDELENGEDEEEEEDEEEDTKEKSDRKKSSPSM